MAAFDELEYTRDNVIKAAIATENHAKDGSAFEGCTCLQKKHYYEVEKYAEEGTLITNRKDEKDFYEKVAPLMRQLRKQTVDQTWNMDEALKEAGLLDRQEEKPKVPRKHFVELNPEGRLYLPHGLTKCEKAHPDVQHKLASCIRDVEEREGCRPPYEDCAVNPVAVCRASVKCPSVAFDGETVKRGKAEVIFDLPSKEVAETEITEDPSHLVIHVNPKLKGNPLLDDVLKHEISDFYCYHDCHSQAVAGERPGAREEVNMLILGHNGKVGL
jgi:hypothetical protein